MKYFIQKMPLVSANDENGKLITWTIANGEKVSKNDIICEVETTKAVADVEAEENGYLFHLVELNEIINISVPIAVIAESPDFDINSISEEEEVTKTLKWTKKAKILATKHGIDIEKVFKDGDYVKEMDVIKLIEGNKLEVKEVKDIVYDLYGEHEERVLILGGGKAAITVADIIMQDPTKKIVGVLDDNPEIKGKDIFGYTILGETQMVYKLWEEKFFDKVIISFSGNMKQRAKLYQEVSSKGIPFTNAIDQSARIHHNVRIGEGNVVFANCRFGTCAIIGNNNVISSYTSLEHHNVLGDHCTFGPGVMTSGTVRIGDRVMFGTGIFVEPRLEIGSDAIISSGSVITINVPENTIVKKVIDIKFQKRS